MADDRTQDSNDELLFHGRLVPDGREGNKVFARSLRPGEEDTGEGVNIRAGAQLIIRAAGRGGYNSYLYIPLTMKQGMVYS